MKYLIAIARIAVSGNHRHEIANWLVEITSQTTTEPALRDRIADVIHMPISMCPTSVARNIAVKMAQERGSDFLYMIDDDQAPASGWFRTAFEFLAAQKTPSVIGSPYVCGGIEQRVQVFEWHSPVNANPMPFHISHILREDAARRTGIEQVANIGTGCLAYDMRVFQAIKPPFFEYTYNEDHTKVVETEDTCCHRKLYFGNVPIFVSWDHWAPHYKIHKHDKPQIVTKNQIQETYLAQARAEMKKE